MVKNKIINRNDSKYDINNNNDDNDGHHNNHSNINKTSLLVYLVQ